MGADLLMTFILGAVFVALLFWVAVRLWTPRRREELPGIEAREARQEVPPQPAPAIASPPTPMPEIDAADVAAAEPEPLPSEPDAPAEQVAASEPVAAAEAVAPPEPKPVAPPEQIELPEPEVIVAAPEPKTKPKRKRAPRKKKKAVVGPGQAQTLGVPAIVHDAYRNIRTWTTSLTPGRALPAILTEPQVERGDPTTYRFKLKQLPYSIVKIDLTEHDDGAGGAGPLVHEKVQLLDDKGTTLFEMSLITADIGSDETPGEITTFSEGPWLDDFRELNILSSKDSKRIGTDFRKKFRAKEQVRLKRDFGV